MLTTSSENRVPEPIRHYVSSPNLKYTRSRCMSQCQYCAKIEIVQSQLFRGSLPIP